MSHVLAASGMFNWDGILRFIGMIGDFLLAIAPALIVLSFVASALMWTMAGSSAKLARKAKEQFVATCLVCVVVGGYFTLRKLAEVFTIGGF